LGVKWLEGEEEMQQFRVPVAVHEDVAAESSID